MRRRQFNRVVGRGPGGRLGSNGTVVNPYLGALTAPVVAEMRAAGRLFVGRTGTGTTAVTDGDLVGSFICSIGVLWAATADGKRMSLTGLGGNKWGLTSDGVDDGYDCATSVNLNGDSWLAIQASQALSGASTRMMQDQGASNCVLAYSRPTNCVYVQADVRGTPIGADASSHTLQLYKASGGAWKLRLDSSDTDLATASVTNEWTRVAIGDSAARSESFAGVWTAAAVYAVNPTLAQRDGIRTLFAATV